jgi:hypothetical protein
LKPELIKPFYEIAKSKLGSEPEYKLLPKHFSGISYQDVVSGFPSGNVNTQKMRYQAAQSFIQTCTHPADGIFAKARELHSLYSQYVPQEMKNRELYTPGNSYQRSCREQGYAGAYPLHTGWLLAVGMYNSGARSLDALAYYNNWDRNDLDQATTWQSFNPLDLIEAFYWGGYYDERTDKITFKSLGGSLQSWIWFKPCVLQRHIARVIQHATLPNTPAIATSLEGSAGCAKSKFDPATGDLVQSAVPVIRQTSLGHK